MAKQTIQAGHIKKVEWAIQVCQSDLNNLRDGDWLNLKEELYEFLTEEIEWSFGLRLQNLNNYDVVQLGILIVLSVDPSLKPSQIKKEDLDQVMALANKDRRLWNRTLRIENAQIINGVLWSMIKSIQSDDYPNFIHFNPRIDSPMLTWNRSMNDRPTNIRDLITGSTGRPFLFRYTLAGIASRRLKLYLIATGLEKSQIQTCPECSRVFVVKRKPRPDVTHHCSKTCAQLAATRRYRGKNKAKVKAGDRDRSHRRYQQRVKQQPGHAHSNVKSNPRKVS